MFTSTIIINVAFHFQNGSSLRSRLLITSRRLHINDLENQYSDTEKEKIIQVINESDAEVISK